eukprot:CAMPEP_0113422210 /NCGR_PEP_ID=MMETSP0013_2-20120614/28337_1 /TAXON_ID=2843 ORGANISM="Skeletonema costatum, Strain 1716" /NCGR_SAMPLE_ID=MMETSP0013_2 /ASSEMBLY_ACC=CAM_ASM_000158 /LENGTH=1367 /DNA_ID=CAMNT_0000309935 /DNA_START=266 /DNA_END=4369 /DNA_ORIENTATION=- /assembly_acc=CAM_ASM_000158
MPEFDRLYLDMNGIIHCASHNNSEEELEKEKELNADNNGNVTPELSASGITEEQIFQNVCYYLDRVVSDIVQPKQLVYLAIDGVAPRAKMNQQRSRRYRSGGEKEIEMHLMTLQSTQGRNGKYNEDDNERMSREYLIEADGGAFDGYWSTESNQARGSQRFTGTMTAGSDSSTVASPVASSANVDPKQHAFHSNSITPGTPFLYRCSQNILAFVRQKLETDPKWQDLTIIFSGHDVPGEGEHKIMDFIRHEKTKPGYDPNTRHCVFGQDGDLIMLGLATHEPHFCLLREEVVFDMARKKAVQALAKLENQKELNDDSQVETVPAASVQPPLSAAIQSYIHNSNFELLHLSVLRDYLALEFETSEFYPSSKYKLEPTIDDFVFMTFLVGNDFLPHMPALDIGEEAFDLIFYAYKKNRGKWLSDGRYRRTMSAEEESKTHTINHPYLTDAGRITSGSRLESFLADVGRYEDPFYENKKLSMSEDNERMRKADKKAGRESLIPSDEILEQVEQAERERYRDMLIQKSAAEDKIELVEDAFSPVTSTQSIPEVKFDSTGNESDDALISKFGGILRESLSPEGGGVANIKAAKIDDSSLVDLKGRYYYDKFGFTPFDAEKHLALRKAYLEGLVWTLEYYYRGCPSWEWYYPYHYGPMISDLVNLNSMLEDMSFFSDKEEPKPGVRRVAGEPLRPFEQLLGCLPPSSSYLLPEPYRWLMTSPDSPLIDFYPESFTVDMNGKRWPWEAVTLLPFIDSAKLSDATRSLIDENKLTEEEKRLNQFGNAHVLTKSSTEILGESPWAYDEDADVAFHPQLHAGTSVPYPSFPSLKDAPIKKLNRRKVFANVFGLRSRYRTALLEMEDDLPPLPPVVLLAQKFIGTTVYFRYPILHEGLVCSVSDSSVVYRGNEKPRKFSDDIRAKRKAQLAKMQKTYMIGEGISGTGGWVLPQVDVTLTVRPLERIETSPDGTKAKVYAKSEVEVPLVAALFTPSQIDSRFHLPAKLEENPFKFGQLPSMENVPDSHSTDRIFNGNKRFDNMEGNQSRRGKKAAKAGSTRYMSTFTAVQTPFAALLSNNTRGNMIPRVAKRDVMTQRSFASAARRGGGDPRRRLVGTATAIAIASLFCLLQVSFISVVEAVKPNHFSRLMSCRGGEIDDGSFFESNISPTPPIDIAHGTTTISFLFKGGIIAAVDSRASIGSFVGSKTTQKVLPVSKTVLGTMAGGAADCSYWIRFLRNESKMHELTHDGRAISVARASRILSSVLYGNRGLDLSVGTMIMGYDKRDGFSIYYIDNTGVRIKGDMFAVGSGSTFALGILDTEERKFDMSEEEAVALGIKAIRHATLRDAASGGFIGVYLINEKGWRKVFSQDLAKAII